eukprot:TRINITY_DN14091_c0_g1_i1.p1 TRINITY_DN14091_c0_g1~~TRINITY_DN14091_c0_g1_i1.p1  ORF type:complete len:70 (+),score=4.49 TRINITY_DN14091_c0_g1_i1:147-356(+)
MCQTLSKIVTRVSLCHPKRNKQLDEEKNAFSYAQNMRLCNVVCYVLRVVCVICQSASMCVDVSICECVC